MPTASGIDAQLMFAPETTPGTYVTPSRGLPHVNYDFEWITHLIKQKSTFPGWYTPPPDRPGKQEVKGGKIELEFAPQGIGHFLSRVMGANTDSGTNPNYIHTMTMGQTLAEGATSLNFAVPGPSGVESWAIAGAQFPSYEIESDISSDDNVKIAFEFFGQQAYIVDGTKPLPTFAMPTGWSPIRPIDVTVSLDGADFPHVKFNLKVGNGLQNERWAAQATPANSAIQRVGKIAKRPEITGTISAEYVGPTWMNKFLTGATAELVAVFGAGTPNAQASFAATIQFTPTMPKVEQEKLTMQDLPFQVVRLTSETEAQGFQLTLKNGDSAP